MGKYDTIDDNFWKAYNNYTQTLKTQYKNN